MRAAPPCGFPAPPWLLGMSKDFQKDIRQIDRNIQGQILEALDDLVTDPIKPHGDTIKPLTGSFRGCWRYRIGRFRLVYFPDANSGNITLLAFSSRGSSYDA